MAKISDEFIKNIKLVPPKKQFICVHCKQGFVREQTLITHLCEKKRRFLAKNEKSVTLGLMAFQQFYKLVQKDPNQKTYNEFVNSNHYNGFVKFGSFIGNVKPLYTDRYIDYIVTSGLPLDKWCSEKVYYDYVLDLIKKESPETAIHRSVTTMISWSESSKLLWNDYFKQVNQNTAVTDIKDGKMSPWLLLNSNTAKVMLSTFDDFLLDQIYPVLDPAFWQRKFKQCPDDVQFAKDVANQGGF